MRPPSCAAPPARPTRCGAARRGAVRRGSSPSRPRTARSTAPGGPQTRAGPRPSVPERVVRSGAAAACVRERSCAGSLRAQRCRRRTESRAGTGRPPPCGTAVARRPHPEAVPAKPPSPLRFSSPPFEGRRAPHGSGVRGSPRGAPCRPRPPSVPSAGRSLGARIRSHRSRRLPDGEALTFRGHAFSTVHVFASFAFAVSPDLGFAARMCGCHGYLYMVPCGVGLDTCGRAAPRLPSAGQSRGATDGGGTRHGQCRAVPFQHRPPACSPSVPRITRAGDGAALLEGRPSSRHLAAGSASLQTLRVMWAGMQCRRDPTGASP